MKKSVNVKKRATDTRAGVIPVETDVLVIGGGLAGCMAAIKAAESGVKVTIAEKANTLSSGCAGTGIDHVWGYFPAVHGPMGWTIEDLIEDHTRIIARGLIDKELLYLVASESYDRVLDLEKFGVNFRYEDSIWPGKFRMVTQFHSVPTTWNFDGVDLKIKLTREAKRRGVSIINRVMVVDLLVSDGRIAGALGVDTRNGKIYLFKAKAVVVSTGRVNRLSRTVTGVWGNHRVPVNETGDGRAMALRAGVPIINMEFFTPPGYSIGNFELNLGSPRNTVQPAGSVVGPKGEAIIPRTYFHDWDKLAGKKVDPSESRRKFEEARVSPLMWSQLHDKGEGPFYLDLTGGTEQEIQYIEWSISNEGKGSYFLDYLKKQEKFDFRKDKLEWLPNSRELAGTAASGLLVNKNLETRVKGLFAAGDDVGGVPWMCSPGAFTMGWRAGEMAGKAAQRQKTFVPTKNEALQSFKQFCSQTLRNSQGVDWQEAELALQNIMDYYAGSVRSELMLRRGVERLQELKQKVSFRADTPHELGRCLEVKSIMENAEMIVRASLERRESRRAPYGFYRADYPEQDDKNWLAFLAMKLDGQKFTFSKVPVK
jgi:succinate dehydrogenase/fumarate reductase flavoprotein subunit